MRIKFRGIQKFCTLSFIIIALLTSLSIIGFAQENVTGEVYLLGEQPMSQVLSEIQKYNSKGYYVTREYRVHDQIRTDGFSVDSFQIENAQHFVDQYWESNNSMLRDLQNGIDRLEGQQDLNEAAAEAWATYVSNIQAQLAEVSKIEGCWLANDCPDIPIVRITVSGSRADLERLAKESDVVDKIEIERFTILHQDIVLQNIEQDDTIIGEAYLVGEQSATNVLAEIETFNVRSLYVIREVTI